MYMIMTSLIIPLLAYNSNYIIYLLVNIVYCEEVCIESTKNLFLYVDIVCLSKCTSYFFYMYINNSLNE
ncbi:Hypothetical protein ERGA_CDS_06910 [Ehrlichia ruminantium str. Gardel]|nr:Hypothetical protein ERGA_CDS_06910 [Ehrlichia ruminantium str. Gardel]